MTSIVNLLFSILLTFMVQLLVKCDGMPIDEYLDLSTNLTARRKAEEHFRMIETRTCTTPVPKLFAVDDIYSRSDVKYKPHCVELFRCDKDAGCCKSDSDVCTPSETETVHLHITVTNKYGTKIWLMPFLNHTSCECRPLSRSYDPCMNPMYEVSLDER